MIFTKETHKSVFDGFILKDCAIQNSDRQMYLLVEDNDEKIKDGYLPEYLFLYTYAHKDEPSERYFFSTRTHLGQPKIDYSLLDEDIIGLDSSGQFYSEGMDGDRNEKDLPIELDGCDYAAVYNNVKTIGNSMYAIGDPRKLFKRLGVDDWIELSKDIPLPKVYANGEWEDEFFGWNDADGFTEQDMYLVGGDGEVWHYDGSNFSQCDFPSNELLANVCCAGDGNVYVGGNLGRLWKGKGDKWELVSKREFSIDWKDIVWFDNRLFLGSDYGLWEFKDGEVITAEVPAQVRSCSGALSICPESKLLLTAGKNGASMYDGKEWKVLFNQFDLED